MQSSFLQQNLKGTGKLKIFVDQVKVENYFRLNRLQIENREFWLKLLANYLQSQTSSYRHALLKSNYDIKMFFANRDAAACGNELEMYLNVKFRGSKKKIPVLMQRPKRKVTTANCFNVYAYVVWTRESRVIRLCEQGQTQMQMQLRLLKRFN